MRYAGKVKEGAKIKCYRCGRKLSGGDDVFSYRERAVSYREAMHAGTMHLKRRICEACYLRGLREVKL